MTITNLDLDPAPATVLDVRHLTVEYPSRAGTVHAVSDVSFTLGAAETLGVVGESGCGKSSLARALLQMPPPTGGEVHHRGTELTALRAGEMRQLRTDLQMIFQDPLAALNPRRTVRAIVEEPLVVWRRGTRQERRAKVDEMLDRVGLDPQLYGDRRPAELSGGQCQRVSIARALVGGARLLVCDEPVAALDVSLRATVLNLVEDLRAELGISVLFISHDLSVVKNVCDRVLVLYLGKVVEEGPTEAVFAAPMHPYTAALMDVVPVPDPDVPVAADVLRGDPPSPLDLPRGCRFASRCPRRGAVCETQHPPLLPGRDGRSVACHFPVEEPPAQALPAIDATGRAKERSA